MRVIKPWNTTGQNISRGCCVHFAWVNEINMIVSFYGVLWSVKLTLIDLTALRLPPSDFR